MQFISGGGANSVDKFRTQESNLDLALSMLKTTLLLNIILFLLNIIFELYLYTTHMYCFKTYYDVINNWGDPERVSLHGTWTSECSQCQDKLCGCQAIFRIACHYVRIKAKYYQNHCFCAPCPTTPPHFLVAGMSEELHNSMAWTV